LNVPVVKQPINKPWCFVATTKSVMNYYGMEITQEELADYVIEDGSGNASLLAENADKLGIEVVNKRMYLEEIKDEIIKKGNPVIVLLDYSLEQKGNHFYVVDGVNEEGLRLMCPNRGFVYWSYDFLKQINENYWSDSPAVGYEPHLYEATLIQPKN